jgi:hypothetical protein
VIQSSLVLFLELALTDMLPYVVDNDVRLDILLYCLQSHVLFRLTLLRRGYQILLPSLLLADVG